MKSKLQKLLFCTAILAAPAAYGTILPNQNAERIKTILNTPDNLKTFQNISFNGMLITNTCFTPVVMTSVSGNSDISDNLDDMAPPPHHSGGSGDDGDLKGKNIISAGVGFLSLTSLMASAYTTAGYSGSSVLPITIQYERGLSSNFTFGLAFVYSSVTMNLNGSTDNTAGFYPHNIGQVYNWTDKLSLSGMEIAVTGDYYFVTSGVFQPYLGFRIGYEPITFGWSTNDPNTTWDGNVAAGSIAGGLPCWGIYFGTKIWFSNNFGAWVDGGWHGLFGAIFNLGLAAKF